MWTFSSFASVMLVLWSSSLQDTYFDLKSVFNSRVAWQLKLAHDSLLSITTDCKDNLYWLITRMLINIVWDTRGTEGLVSKVHKFSTTWLGSEIHNICTHCCCILLLVPWFDAGMFIVNYFCKEDLCSVCLIAEGVSCWARHHDSFESPFSIHVM